MYDTRATIIRYDHMDELEKEDPESEGEDEALLDVSEEPAKPLDGRRKLTDPEARGKSPTPENTDSTPPTRVKNDFFESGIRWM